MMNKEKKKMYIEEMKDFFNKKSSIFVTHYQGLTVKHIDELRTEIKRQKLNFLPIPVDENISIAIISPSSTICFSFSCKLTFGGF